ncbi:MAG: hypothetical protein DMG86_15125 [Acidobacteria bacterium]|nr:MAG: hypothetical protein DMG86_15125 [Acidobacteriota bacterium]
MLIFFIAGLLYLLRFERVDNLGAYSIPSETGLLIPLFTTTMCYRVIALPILGWCCESVALDLECNCIVEGAP